MLCSKLKNICIKTIHFCYLFLCYTFCKRTCIFILLNYNNIHLFSRQGLLTGQAGPINIPSISHQYQHHSYQPQSPQKLLKLSPRPSSSYPYPSHSSASPPALLALSVGKTPSSPSRRLRGENKKCRKVYGMEHRELWCTQCKWKKACSRFGD